MRRRAGWPFGIVLLLLAGLLPATFGQAAELEPLTRQRQDFGLDLEQLQKEQQQVLGELFALNRRLQEIRLHIADLQTQEQEAALRLARVQAEAERLQELYHRRRTLFGRRVRFLYEHGISGYLEVLLGASDLKDFLERAAYVEYLVRHDAGLLTEVRTLRAAVAQSVARARAERDRLASLRAEEQIQEADLLAAQSDREARLGALQERRTQVESTLADLEELWTRRVEPVLAAFGEAFHTLTLQVTELSPDALEFTPSPPTARLTLGEASLNRFIARLPVLRDLSFVLQPGQTVLRGQFDQIPLEIEGRFEIAGPKSLRYQPGSIRFFGVPIPPRTTAELIRSGRLDVDLGTLIPDPARLLELKVVAGQLVLVGGIR